MPHDFPPENLPVFTKFRSTKRISKSFKWDVKKEKLVKEPGGHLESGNAETKRLRNPADLVMYLSKATQHDAFCWGQSPYPRARVTTAKNLPKIQSDENPLIARTRKFFSFPEGKAGVMMFDVDPPKDGSAAPLTLDEAIDAMVRCCPDASTAAMVCAYSSSSNIWRGEACLQGAGGLHLYMFAQDASDIIRAGKVLYARSWLMGYGRIIIGGAGQSLERSFIDAAVWQPERLDFGMYAYCDGVKQRHPDPVIRNEAGQLLIDTRKAFPDLTREEEARFKEMVAEAKKARADEARQIREEWARNLTRETLKKKGTTPEESPAESTAMMKRFCDSSTTLALDADMPIYHVSGKAVTVAEIMANPEKWRGERFGDPLEPGYSNNDLRIAYLDERGGKWGIYSHAHGGISYTLPLPAQAKVEPEHNEVEGEELPKVTENYQNEQTAQTGNPFDDCLNIAELLATEPPEMQWFAKDRLPQGRGFLLTGVGGVSKSTMLKQLGFAAVLGRALWGWEFPRTGKALLMLTEDTRDDAHTSLKDIADAMLVTPTEKSILASGLYMRPFAGQDSLLLRKDKQGRLCRSALYEQLLAKVKALGDCVFVGIDPALAVSEGDELDQQSQRALAKMADDLAVNTGATVLLVTHGTKALIGADEIGSHSSRGGGAVTDGARGEYVLRSMTTQEAKRAGIDDPEERARIVQLVCSKGNRIPPSAKVPVWLRRGNGGVLAEVVLDMTSGATCTTDTKDDKIFEVLLDIGKGGPAKRQEWMEACADRGILRGKATTQNQYIKEAASRLKAAGKVVSYTTGYYSPCDPEPEQEW